MPCSTGLDTYSSEFIKRQSADIDQSSTLMRDFLHQMTPRIFFIARGNNTKQLM